VFFRCNPTEYETKMKNCTAFAQFYSARLGNLLFLIRLAFYTLGVSASAQQLSMTTFNVPAAGTGAYEGTYGSSINPRGEITGTYTDSNHVEHGFLRSPDGVITTFTPPHASRDGCGSFANDINPEGLIVGDYTNSIFNYGGFIRMPAGMIETHRLLVEPGGTVIAYDAPGAGKTPGNPANISPLGDYLYQGTNLAGYAPGLNIWGAVTSGYLDENYVYHGYLRNPDGTLIDFDAPDAGKDFTQGTIPLGLNDLGVITGFYFDRNNVNHGFVGYPGGTWTDFDAPGADRTDAYYGTFPESVNDSGVITGHYLTAGGVYHGFLRSPNGTIKTFDAPGADLTPGDFNGTFPASMNPFGAITGNYVDANNVSHGFEAVPCFFECQGDPATTLAVEGPMVASQPAPKLRPFHGRVRPYRGMEAKPL
jgi:hypothetical protein